MPFVSKYTNGISGGTKFIHNEWWYALGIKATRRNEEVNDNNALLVFGERCERRPVPVLDVDILLTSSGALHVGDTLRQKVCDSRGTKKRRACSFRPAVC